MQQQAPVENLGSIYTPNYCEENVYRLCEGLLRTHKKELYVVFISNNERRVPIYMQDVAQPGDAVTWDYHVICVELSGDEGLVYDLARLFRVVPALTYLRHFASDRSHMWDQGGVPGWSSPPPPHPPIVAPDGVTMNLERYWSMEEGGTADDGRYGSVLSEAEFLAFFGGSKARRRPGARVAVEGITSAASS